MLKLVVVTWRIFTLSQNSSSIFSSYFFCRIQPKYNSSSSSQNVRRRTDAGTSRRRWRRSWGWSRGGSKEININLTSVQNIPINGVKNAVDCLDSYKLHCLTSLTPTYAFWRDYASVLFMNKMSSTNILMCGSFCRNVQTSIRSFT